MKTTILCALAEGRGAVGASRRTEGAQANAYNVKAARASVIGTRIPESLRNDSTAAPP